MIKKIDGKQIYNTWEVTPAERMLIAGGRVVDSSTNTDTVAHIIVENKKIAGIELGELPPEGDFDLTINAGGKWVVPGLVDTHVHLREPGREDKETIETGTRAATAGGYTSIACMPNTFPVLDEESKIRYVVQRARDCTCTIYPLGAQTRDLAGKELAPIGEMVMAGAVGVSEASKTVANSDLMRNIFNYSRAFNIPVFCHNEDVELTRGRHMNESTQSTRLGIHGMPSIAEQIMVARHIMLAEYTQARLHLATITTRGAIELIRSAKKRGVAVTAETAPHYLIFNDESFNDYNTNRKTNPPLRSQSDVDALIEAVADGTIDAICSDHEPHVPEDKDVEFDAAAFGVIGLETTAAAVLTHLYHTKAIPATRLIEALSFAPAKLLNIAAGTLRPGSIADIAIVDPKHRWVVNPKHFFSKAQNCAFSGMEFCGAVTTTLYQGAIVYQNNHDGNN